jgi:O-antigen/teichoic acid export membrane protein
LIDRGLVVERESREGLHSLFRALSVSTVNQIVTSGTNFVLSLFLIKILTVSEFGLYGILQAVAFILAGIGNSVYLTQMVVHYPDKAAGERTAYVSSVLSLCMLSGAIVFFSVFVIILVLEKTFNIELLHNILSVVSFSVSFLVKEFYCRLAYSYRLEARSLRVNIVVAVTLLALISVLTYSDFTVSACSVLYCYAISIIAGSFMGHLESRLSVRADWDQMCDSMTEVWRGGKWALANDLLSSVRQQAHIFITAAIAGSTGVAMINAAKIFLTPVMLITPSFSQIFIVRLVALRQLEPLKLLRNGILFSSANAASVVLYGLIMFYSFDYISVILLGEKFPEIGPYVIAWFFVALFSAGRYGLEAILKAMKRFKSLALLNVPVSIIALLAVYLLIIALGPVGSIYGLAVAEFLLILILIGLVVLSTKKIQKDLVQV